MGLATGATERGGNSSFPISSHPFQSMLIVFTRTAFFFFHDLFISSRHASGCEVAEWE